MAWNHFPKSHDILTKFSSVFTVSRMWFFVASQISYWSFFGGQSPASDTIKIFRHFLCGKTAKLFSCVFDRSFSNLA